MMKLDWAFGYIVAIFGSLLAVAVITIALRAQDVDSAVERIVQPPTIAPRALQWQVAEVPSAVGLDRVRVDVVDIAGVCLYIVRAPSGSNGRSVSVAAVPKTALVPGVGCQ